MVDTPGTGAAETVFGLLALGGVSRYRLTSSEDAGVEPDRALDRGTRGLILGVLVFRSAATVVPLAVLGVTYGLARSAIVGAIAAALIGLDILALLRLAGVRRLDRLAWLSVGVAAAANLACAAALPGPLNLAFHNAAWPYLAGAVMLVAIARRATTGTGAIEGGLAIVLASVSLQVIMAQLNRAGHLDVGALLGRTLWLAVALVVAVVAVDQLGVTARLALAQGVGRGQAAERARLLRTMHDTVLQTLEAMSLESDLDRSDPQRALAELRGAARREAGRLRRTLSELGAARSAGLTQSLSETIDEAAGHDLRVKLVASDVVDAHEPTQARRDALRAALREALGNVRKHAGTTAALVRVDAADGGVQVIVRDHGCGFTVDATPAGFGLRESIVGRLAEVGGSATVESWPGRGTRVRLWVPA